MRAQLTDRQLDLPRESKEKITEENYNGKQVVNVT